MTRFNLSEWAVNNKAVVVFIMLLCAIGGLGAVVVGRAETEGPEVISVPANALLQSGDGPQVWVVAEGGTVHRRAVELLEFSADTFVVRRGLSAGEKVVTAGVNSLAEGQPVAPGQATWTTMVCTVKSGSSWRPSPL